MFLNNGGYLGIQFLLICLKFLLSLLLCVSLYFSTGRVELMPKIVGWIFLWEIIKIVRPFAHFHSPKSIEQLDLVSCQ
ncbi:hypothetical protein SAMN05880566_10585 [Janthinobacterium sp. TND4EL3]|nr:hypothetical protein SAMN05880566_10585 [Janthinobacterium sp. TND4EL3]